MGSAHGYHPGTFGWLVGEVIRRISGKTPGRFLAEEVSGPLGLEFWIGLPESEEHRMTTVQSVDPRFDRLGDPESMTEPQRNMIAASKSPILCATCRCRSYRQKRTPTAAHSTLTSNPQGVASPTPAQWPECKHRSSATVSTAYDC